MPIAAIIFQQNGDGYSTPVSRDDLALTLPITVLNQNDAGVTTWLWHITDKPTGSTAVFASSSASYSTQSTDTFIPDLAGTYLIRLEINAGAAQDQKGAAVKTANLHYRVPAAKETTEFDGYRGWAIAANNAFNLLDAYAITTPPPPPSLQTAYNGGTTIVLQGAEGNAPVSIAPNPATTLGQTFVVNDNSGNPLLSITDSGTGGTPRGTVFCRRLFLFGSNEVIGWGGNTGDVLTYDSGTSQWTPQPPYKQDVFDYQITTTSATNILSFTPASNGNFKVMFYYRVVNAGTNVAISLTYADNSGAQIMTVLSTTLKAIGSYSSPPIYIQSLSSPILLTFTIGIANNVFVSATIDGA
jgi:hypothetical protein